MNLTSRPPLTRNSLSQQEQDLVDRYRAMVVRELNEFMSEEDKHLIAVMPQDQVCILHHSLGCAIRNEYELWMPEHEVSALWHQAQAAFPLDKESQIDDHPCHPDNFSMSCVLDFWKALQ